MELTIDNQEVQIASNGYICLTDLAKIKGGSDHLKNWLRNAETIAFIEAWEKKHNPDFNWVEFDPIKEGIGLHTYKVSVKQLVKAGTKCITAQRGRYGGTYGAPQLALHFANWLDARFYLEVIDEYLQLIQDTYGEDAGRWRFARELAAENYDLQKNAKKRLLPEEMDTMSLRQAFSSEADIINLAVFNQTAKNWRIKNSKKTGNMRDYATPEELKVVAQLEYLNAQYIEHGADQQSRLLLLTKEAGRLLEFYTGHHIRRELKKQKKKLK